MASQSRLIVSGPEDVAIAAADQVMKIAQEALGRHPTFSLVLSGGSTPKRLYELMAEAPYRGQIPWGRTHFFWGDERCVPPGHPDSNFRMAWETLLERQNLSQAQVHRIRAEHSDPHLAAREYENEIRAYFGLGPEDPAPSFDLLLLGLGPDGHTASLFPQTPALKESKKWVVAHHIPQLKADRLTLTPPMINRAACILFLVTGQDKAGAVAQVLEGPPDPTRLPAQLIRPVEGRLLWVLDRSAARLLKNPSNPGAA